MKTFNSLFIALTLFLLGISCYDVSVMTNAGTLVKVGEVEGESTRLTHYNSVKSVNQLNQVILAKIKEADKLEHHDHQHRPMITGLLNGRVEDIRFELLTIYPARKCRVYCLKQVSNHGTRIMAYLSGRVFHNGSSGTTCSQIAKNTIVQAVRDYYSEKGLQNPTDEMFFF